METFIIIFSWCVVGMISGIVGDKIANEDTTFGSLVWFAGLGFLVFIGVVMVAIIQYFPKINTTEFFKSINRFWRKTIIRNDL